MTQPGLIERYNVAAPRYTSYPTVPFWNTDAFTEKQWLCTVKESYAESLSDGISLYIHLPFCESLCTYCGCNTRITRNHLVEQPYIIAVLKEWKMYAALLGGKPRIRELHLGGGTPTFFTPENLEHLIGVIAQNAEMTPDAVLSFEGHPANTSPEHLQTLYTSGFRRISLGIQDFDPQVQEVINRRQSVEQVAAVVTEARRMGYTSVNFDLIYGLPNQRRSSIEHTFDEVLKLRPDRIAYYSYAHVPWVKPGQRRYTEDDLPTDLEKRLFYELGRERLSYAGYHDIGMDHFALKTDSLYGAWSEKKLHRNFMGYTDRYTQLSIGLGVSSISDSGYAFAQNDKNVESYTEKINSGEFAFIKGHIHTRRDLLVRKHITELMCTGQTQIHPRNGIFREIISKLVPLEQDGLVRINEGRITITEAGMPFLRNVCMCFDQTLNQKKSHEQVFSKAI